MVYRRYVCCARTPRRECLMKLIPFIRGGVRAPSLFFSSSLLPPPLYYIPFSNFYPPPPFRRGDREIRAPARGIYSKKTHRNSGRRDAENGVPPLHSKKTPCAPSPPLYTSLCDFSGLRASAPHSVHPDECVCHL